MVHNAQGKYAYVVLRTRALALVRRLLVVRSSIEPHIVKCKTWCSCYWLLYFKYASLTRRREKVVYSSQQLRLQESWLFCASVICCSKTVLSRLAAWLRR